MSAIEELKGFAARPAAPGLTLDLSAAALFLRRRWRWIAGTAALVGALTALVLSQVPRRYDATATVAVQTQKTQVVDVQDVVSGLTPDAATMETQVAILRSRRLAAALVDRLHLDHDPEFAPRAADREAVIDGVMKAIDIEPLPRSYVVAITTGSHDPVKAARIANALADLYIADGLSTKYAATRRAADYLQQRVGELRDQAVASDRAAEQYRAGAGLMGADDQGGTLASQQLSELSSQLVAARADRAAKEAQLQQVQQLVKSGDSAALGTSSAVLSAPLIQNLREQESQVLRNLAELQATYGERDPKIINAEAGLKDLRAKIGEEVGKLAAASANDVAVARAREGTLAASLGQAEGAVSAGGRAEVKLHELERESDANKGVYQLFLNRLKETRQQVDLQTPDTRLVSGATPPASPAAPRVRPILAAALLIGLAAGLALAITLDRLDNTIRRGGDLEAIGGGAPIGHVPALAKAKGRPEDVVLTAPGHAVVESLRNLRSGLALADVDRPPRLVMLSSSVPGEGKTFTSCGLARVSAQAGARTLLIDADLRHPRVAKAMGIENGPGLVKVLAGEATLSDACAADEATGLDVLTAGGGARNPADLFGSDRMARLLAEARERYDFVVVDAPPFVPMTDSQVLARLVDQLLLVVRWGHTPAPVVETTLRQAHRIGAPLAGVVLSRIDLSRQASYGYGDYGYHYSRYAGYYGATA